MSASPRPPRIGITVGDPAGIGPEVVEAALASGRLDPACSYHLIGGRSAARPGEPTPETARAAHAALEEAASLLLRREIDAVATGPIHKARMHEIGFDFPGQTEFFAHKAGVKDFAMCLTGGSLTVALVTAHVPLREVPSLLSSREIVRVGSLLARFMQSLRQTAPPRAEAAAPIRIAVAGLNPHAGESGALGREEIELIAPSITLLQGQWNGGAPEDSPQVEFSGPHSPDTVFNRAVGGEFDAVLCMYHDQGLIPLKLHAFDQGVNVTLGLPFVRTSPDHGTAFELAGRGKARPDSMIAAIQLAARLAGAR